MGSLKCSGCGFGIHYHDEPNGIQYSAVPLDKWEMYKKTNTPVMCFVSDIDNSWIIMWKCPECGAFHRYDEHWRVSTAYKPDFDDRVPDISGTRLILFSDFLFDYTIGEEDLTASQFEESSHYKRTLFAILNDESISVFSNRECTRFLLKFKSIPILNE